MRSNVKVLEATSLLGKKFDPDRAMDLCYIQYSCYEKTIFIFNCLGLIMFRKIAFGCFIVN